MSEKSHIVIKVSSTGTGQHLAKMLLQRAEEALNQDSDITVLDIHNRLSVSNNEVQLNIHFPFDLLEDLLEDWWVDDCLALVSSDLSACGQYMVFQDDDLIRNLKFGPRLLGVHAGITVENFNFDDLEIDEELKGQPQIKQFQAYFEQETSLGCSVIIYAKDRDEAALKAEDIDSESLIYSETSFIEQRSPQIIELPSPIQYVCGATCKVRMSGETEIVERYFSFGQYDESKETDTFGRDDQTIFYNAFEGEAELKTMIENHAKGLDVLDFDLISYELNYSSTPEYLISESAEA